MKSMTCNQLGGACDEVFQAQTFDEMAELSKAHAMKMLQAQDAAHLAAMQDMQQLMKNPDEMKGWFAAKRKEFDDMLRRVPCLDRIKETTGYVPEMTLAQTLDMIIESRRKVL